MQSPILNPETLRAKNDKRQHRSAEAFANQITGETLTLGIRDFTYHDLFRPEKLRLLQARFVDDLIDSNPALGSRYKEVINSAHPTREDETWVVINVGPHLSRFLGKLFGLDKVQRKLEAETRALDRVLSVRRNFVRKRVVKRIKPTDIESIDIARLNLTITKLTQTLEGSSNGES